MRRNKLTPLLLLTSPFILAGQVFGDDNKADLYDGMDISLCVFDLEEKKLFFEQLTVHPSQFSEMQALADGRVLLSYQQIHHEIVLPPPEA